MADPLTLDAQVCFPLYAALRAINAAYRPKLDELGLTYPQYLVMLALWERDGRSVGELCTALGLDTGTLSPLLKRLQGAGLVERTRSTADERRVEIHLTEAGRELRAAACGLPEQLAAATGLSIEELGTLRDLLRRMTRALAERS
ncbi:MarR family winged helix-turn-helix transcriptional regulator [Nocardia arthritidis]|uniref:MarR family transcriptional regulator n=1 Tax=Nocardia arthritidis TaxID=228602 RepID=A0A6G9Y986_9NOCA|nr:MarR family transcriptional regulator [Nocardia arthritidis]QIS09616.1 MarR family transcriptional regulator [Nocardia arthritidis]